MENITKIEHYDERFYRIEKNGKVDYYPSVTTKLQIVAKPFLAEWRGNLGNREADLRMFEAAERGTRIHAAWERMTTGGAVIYQPPKKPTFTAEEIKRISDEHNGLVEIIKYQDEMIQCAKLEKLLKVLTPQIIASEVIVYSDKYREAGTIDNVFGIKEGSYLINGRKPLYLKGGTYIGDLKTGNSFDDNAYMQMAGYAFAWVERYPTIKIEGTLGIHTGSKNKTGIPGLSVFLRTQEEMQQDFKDFRNVSSMWERKHKNDKPETYEFPSLITLKKELHHAGQRT
jgi:hypothetical protein